MSSFQNTKTSVLFVCMGNICRSPTADAVFRHQVKKAGLEQAICIDSAGTHAYHIGKPPDQRAQNSAQKRGYRMHDLRARKVTDEDFSHFDYILAMDHENLAILQQRCPQEFRNKLQLLMHYSVSGNNHQEVADPYFGGEKGFETVLDMIEEASQGLIEHIHKATP